MQMVHYPVSGSLKAGQIQLAPAAAYVHGLPDFKVHIRPNRHHWQNNRPPVQLSVAQLERQLYLTGNQADSRTYVQYCPGDKTKLAVDCDSYSSTNIALSKAFAMVNSEVLQPIITSIATTTGKLLSVDELVIEAACRETKPDNGHRQWKQSFHVFFPEISITCKRIADLLDHLEIPPIYCDRAPWRGESCLSRCS
jgi:hypothetical protein